MLNVTKALAEAAPLFKRIYLRHFIPLSFFLVLATLFCMGVEAVFAPSFYGNDQWKLQVATGLSQLLTDMAFVLLMAWALFGLEKKELSFSSFMSLKFKPLVAENLRALAQILLWSLALVIPGIYKYVLYTFVNYVVFFDDDYDSGKVDALNESARLTRLHFFKIFAVMVVLGGISFAIEIGPRSLGLTSAFLDFVFSILSYLFSGYVFTVFYLLYKNLKLQQKWKE